MVTMKRRDLLNEAKRIAKARGESYDLTEGGNHSIIRIGDDVPVSVPRHNEINELTAKAIIKQLNQNNNKTTD